MGETGDAAPTGEVCEPAGTELPEVAGEAEAAPTLTWPDACAPEGLQSEVLVEGDGAPVAEGSAVVAHYAGYVWGSDTPFDSSFDRGSPSMFSLSSVVEGWTTGIPDNAVGSRLLLSIPPELGYGEAGNSGAGIGGTDTIVFVIDVVAAYGPDAAGDPDAEPADAADLPVEIEGALGEPAGLTVPEGTADPTEAAAYPVSTGTGPAVAAGQSVAIAYSVVSWDGAMTETSWSPAPDGAERPEGAAPAGPMVTAVGQGSIFDLLDGTTVGSRVVLVAPPSGTSPAIAVVADVLAVA